MHERMAVPVTVRAWVTALALIPAMAGCEYDFSGMFAPTWGGGGYYGSPPPPQLGAVGTVRIGDYTAVEGEAVILVFDPSDTTSAIDSVGTWGGYTVAFGTDPHPAVCGYVARAVLWNGDASELKPLFSEPVSPCTASQGYVSGAEFDFPPYAPLPEPFVLTGVVWMDGRPAGPGSARMEMAIRLPDDDEGLPTTIEPDTDGVISFTTTDRAQWFALCRGVSANTRITGSDIDHAVWLDAIPLVACTRGRRLPDVRVGSRKAAHGWTVLETTQGHVALTSDLGSARVALLDPADSTVIGEEQETLDDGSFHLWYPDDWIRPGCEWLIRARLEGGASHIRLLKQGSTCQDDETHYFAFPG